MFDVIGVGASSVDLVYRVPEPPAFHGPASKLRLSGHAVSCGGQVATAMAAAAACGLRAAYAGAVGNDEHGRLILAALDTRGVDVSLAPVKPGGSQFAAILVDERSGERVVLWDRPDTLRLSAEDLPADAIRACRCLLVDDVDPEASLAAARLAREAGVPVVTDLDHVTPQTEALIRTATHPILSEHLPVALTGASDLENALRALRAWNPGPITTTLGERGAMTLERDAIVRAGGYRVAAVDTTGSGDVFRGAFIAGLLAGLPLPALLDRANAAAALSCTRPGALDGVPDAAAVERLLAGRGDGPALQ